MNRKCIKAVCTIHLLSDSWATLLWLAVCVFLQLYDTLGWRQKDISCQISSLQTLWYWPHLCGAQNTGCKQTVEIVVVMLVVAMCDGHAVSRSQNGGRHPALQQQPQKSQGDDGPLAVLARCGALAAAGKGCITAGKSIQRPPPPPARVAPSIPSVPPPLPPPPPMNGNGDCIACHMARE